MFWPLLTLWLDKPCHKVGRINPANSCVVTSFLKVRCFKPRLNTHRCCVKNIGFSPVWGKNCCFKNPRNLLCCDFSTLWYFCCHQTVLVPTEQPDFMAKATELPPTNSSSEELLYRVDPTQCRQLLCEPANGSSSPPPRFEPPDTKKPITGHTSLSPAEHMLPSSWWNMQDLVVYILLRLRGPSMFPTYKIYYYSWSSPLTTWGVCKLGALVH